MILNQNKILVVDDEKALRVGLAHCIKNAGFEPVIAADGEEALQLFEEHRPAMVILDVMMNGLSGLEVCRLLRKKTDTVELKIVFLSAKGQLKEQAEGLEAGADYYITKPFSYKELLNIVKELLRVVNE